MHELITRINEVANTIKDGRHGAASWIFIKPTHPRYDELKKEFEKRNNEPKREHI